MFVGGGGQVVLRRVFSEYFANSLSTKAPHFRSFSIPLLFSLLGADIIFKSCIATGYEVNG
jgi:hypothetical protein